MAIYVFILLLRQKPFYNCVITVKHLVKTVSKEVHCTLLLADKQWKNFHRARLRWLHTAKSHFLGWDRRRKILLLKAFSLRHGKKLFLLVSSWIHFNTAHEYISTLLCKSRVFELHRFLDFLPCKIPSCTILVE